MLVPVVHLPKLYGCRPPIAGEPKACLRCAAQVDLLTSALRNCALLVDEGGEMTREMFAGLRRVHPVYRERVRALGEALRKRKRLVKVQVPSAQGSTCGSTTCDLGMTIAATYPVRCLVTPGGCTGCLAAGVGCPYTVSLEDFQLSLFAVEREQLETLLIDDATYDRQRVEQILFDPILRYARNVKLYDRQIGRSVRASRPEVGENFSRTIRWILERFVTVVPADQRGVFEITTGIDAFSVDTEQEVEQRAWAVYRFGRDLERDFGHAVTVYVRKEGTERNNGGMTHNQLHHDRFLITDPISLQIGRGFDLLDSHQRVRATAISPVKDPGAVEQQASSIPLIDNPLAGA